MTEEILCHLLSFGFHGVQRSLDGPCTATAAVTQVAHGCGPVNSMLNTSIAPAVSKSALLSSLVKLCCLFSHRRFDSALMAAAFLEYSIAVLYAAFYCAPCFEALLIGVCCWGISTALSIPFFVCKWHLYAHVLTLVSGWCFPYPKNPSNKDTGFSKFVTAMYLHARGWDGT